MAHARAAGCLWLALTGWLFLFLATVGAVVPVDPTQFTLPYLGPPVLLALLVFLAGHLRPISVLAVVAGFAYAAIGSWNFVRADAFERQNPGSVEVSGGGISVIFVLIAVAISLWSFSALMIRRRRAPGSLG